MKKLNTKTNFLNSKKKIYCTSIAVISLICGSPMAQAMVTDERAVEEITTVQRLIPGIYKIKNMAHNKDNLTYTDKKTKKGGPGGHYAQVLESGRYTKRHYEINGRYKNTDLWDISYAEDGAYIIKNVGAGVGVNSGLLAYTDSEDGSWSGYYSTVLRAGEYDPADYENPNGIFRKKILWDLMPAEGGSFIIKNRSLKDGILAFSGAESSASGKYAQVLESRHKSYYKPEKYHKKGIFRNHILWNLAKATKQ